MFKIRVESDQATLVNKRGMLSLNFRCYLGQAEYGGLESEGRLQVHDVIKRRTNRGSGEKTVVVSFPVCTWLRVSAYADDF